MFRYLVLGLLRGGASRHGYALMKEYRERSGLQLSTGNFYRELQRLVAEGFVRTATNPEDADPRRAPYKITDTGSAAFDTWLAGPPGSGIGRYEDELSSRAFFLAEVELGVARTLLATWKEELWIRNKIHERARSTALRSVSQVPTRTFAALPLFIARSLKHIAADLEFLDEFAAAYEQWAVDNRMVDREPVRTTRTLGRRSRRSTGSEE